MASHHQELRTKEKLAIAAIGNIVLDSGCSTFECTFWPCQRRHDRWEAQTKWVPAAYEGRSELVGKGRTPCGCGSVRFLRRVRRLRLQPAWRRLRGSWPTQRTRRLE